MKTYLGLMKRKCLRSLTNSNMQPTLSTTEVNTESKHILEETIFAKNRERKINIAHCNTKFTVKYPEYSQERKLD